MKPLEKLTKKHKIMFGIAINPDDPFFRYHVILADGVYAKASTLEAAEGVLSNMRNDRTLILEWGSTDESSD